LQAFVAATQEHDLFLADAKTQAEWKMCTDRINEQIKQLQQRMMSLDRKARSPLQEQIDALRKTLPTPLPAISTVHDVEKERTTIHVLKRGDPERRGPQVGPRVLSALVADTVPELPANTKKPRTALAQWLNEPAHPLTARVLVNRL